MKKIIALFAVLLCSAPAGAKPYLHAGFNELAGGAFFPVAGAVNDQEAGFVVPAIEHDPGPGGLCIGGWCPGIGWNPLNLGYIGGTGDLHAILHGKLALGPSLQAGEGVKSFIRGICAELLTSWDTQYGALHAALDPGQNGIYADVGVYEAVPLNQLSNLAHVRPETLVGLTLNKKLGGK